LEQICHQQTGAYHLYHIYTSLINNLYQPLIIAPPKPLHPALF
jgi:hypothetical protein